MKHLLLASTLALSGCASWFCKETPPLPDPQAEAIKSLHLQLDPMPPLDLSQYQPSTTPTYLKSPSGTKFVVDYDWLQKQEKLMIELQTRIYLHEKRDELNKDLFEKTKQPIPPK